MRRSTFFAILTPTVVGVFVLGVEIANANRVVRGLAVGSAMIGGHKKEGAETALTNRVQAFLDAPITLSGEGFSVAKTPRDLGVRIDMRATLTRTTAFGREGIFAVDIYHQMHAALSGVVLTPVVTIDEVSYEEALERAFSGVEHPATDATLLWDAATQTFRPQKETPGWIFDRSRIHDAVLSAAATLTPPGTLSLRAIADAPTATSAALPDAQVRAETILSRTPATLRAGDVTLRMTREKLGPLLSFIARKNGATATIDIVLDRSATEAFLASNVASEVDREPINAKFSVVQGRVVTFALARDGQKLDRAGAIAALEQALILAPNDERNAITITLPVTITKPDIGNDAAEALGIRERIAMGETDFAGSPKNRIHNIRVGASRFHGVLIKPGEEFSFVNNLGAVGPETGYLPELVIKQDKTVPEYGGGLCQVSTTAFRAAVAAGLPITERRAHAYIVRYYGTPGFDATIYPPHPDLRFINDTPGYILIQTSVVGTKLRFEFYGTNDGRNVEVLGPRVFNQQADGSAKATLSVRVTARDGTVREQTFTSSYRSPSLYPVERRNPLE